MPKPRKERHLPKLRTVTSPFDENLGVLGFIYPWLHNPDAVWEQTGQDPFDKLYDVD